ncbi:lamin tail domain-containing protein [Aliifodinibius salicampi]|uniref:Lamin tail domain-containing protein n=1 Tax=Fodinibius salicampi TaxID=1920655 RepID=A0ABT3Q310_9BACT|nr:lamin tail domain-containing protein [Fodinibius salicampi]MCW9714507.1 lamin tail domain-containing protein [Fodinibius salicampi]
MSNNKTRLCLLLILILAIPSIGYGQSVNFEDGFEDGDFTENPSWSGDDSLYTITSEEENHLLKLNGNAGDNPAYLSVPSTSISGSWEFYIKLDFSPSSGNRADIFLMSDIPDLTGPVNGYALRAGENGSEDVFRIVRYNNGAEEATVLSGTTDISGGGAFRVKVSRVASGEWTLEVAQGYDGILSQEGSIETDNTYTSSSYFGIRSTYTSTRSDKFFFDFKINLPPFAITETVAADNQVTVYFNRPYDQSTVEVSDFSINSEIGSPASISHTDSVTVTLDYNNNFPSGEYILTVDSINDLNGKTITTTAGSFIVFGYSTPQDVIINEFVYDPPSNFGEYIEIKNRSDKYLNLQDWLVGDESGATNIATEELVLEPNEFMVLSSDTTTLFNTFGNQSYVQVWSLPALNNTGDAIKLISDEGELVDSLYYISAWGGEDIALERRSDSTPAIYKGNWGNSSASLGGTPGQSNQISADTQPPALTRLSIISDNTLQLTFDERIDSTFSNSSNYQISNTSINSVTGLAPDTVQLTLSPTLVNAREYQLELSSIEDIFGNTISSYDTTFTYFEISSADSGDVYISEFMFDPPEETPEYIELHNPTDQTFDLREWTINDNTGNQRPITYHQKLLPPDEFIVLTTDSTLLEIYPDISIIDMASRFPVLNNNGDAIVLRDSSDILLDSLQYSQTWGKKEIALERRSEELSAKYKENWENAPNDFGTPGQPNEIEPDATPPLFTDLLISGIQTIRLTFTETLERASANDVAHYSLSTELEITDASLLTDDSIELTLSDSLRNNKDYGLTVTGLTDLFGNITTEQDTSFTYLSISSVDSGGVFINEFMPDPPDEYSEYIELYNPTSYSFNIQGWTINDNTGNLKTITTERYILPPESFIVVAPDQRLLNHYNNIPIIPISNRFPALNNSGDNIVLRDSSGTLLDSLQYSGSWRVSQQALERRSHKLSAVYQANWGSGDIGPGSPGYKNTVSPDTQAPALFSFHISGPKSFQLSFDEWIDATSLENSFSFAEPHQIADTRFLPPDTVNITLSESFQNAHSYTLEIDGIKDLFGNILSNSDTSFTYYEISPADSGQIFINEFSYNPAPGETEYIEIYNSTNQSFNLKEWTLNDNRGTPIPLTPEKLTFPPKSYVVLAPDNTLLNKSPNMNLVEMGNQFPALNNSGDDIVLKTSDGTLLDSLQYTSSWGGDETGLERKVTNVSGTFRENWGPAPDDGGSPGRPNNILKDQEPPKLAKLYPIDESKVQLIFSETITTASAANFANYKISPARDIQLVSVKSDSVTLFLSESLISGQTYEVTVSNISDIFKNSSTSTSQKIEYLHLEEAVHNDIVINEIMHLPAGDQAEFIELYNRSDKNIDLTNWSFGDVTSEITITEPIQFRSHSYLTISGSTTFAQENNNAISLAAFPNLNNAGDALFMRNEAGETIDSLYYEAFWGENRKGYSLERKDPYSASNDASNWQNNTSENNHSAGVQNISFQEDNVPPKLIFANVRANNQIEVHFDEFIRINDDIQFTVDGKTLVSNSFDSSNANKLLLQEFPTELKGKDSKLTVSNFSDFRGNITGSNKISIAQPVQSKDLVINEIMFDPINNPGDNQGDQSEYIELYNTRDYALSLEGLIFHDAPDEKGSVQTLQPVSTTAKWVHPHETVLIYGDQIQNFEQSKLADFYDLKSTNMQDIVRIDRNSLSLASSNDAIYISDSLGAVIDSVHYSDEWHNPNLLDTKGIALERIDPDGPTNISSNWSSSVESKGGTPKARNSIYQDQPPNPQNTGINFAPNPFSPDGDGYEDNLIISYKLDQSDYLLRVNIFDRYGRHIKELADGKPAGFEGTLIWDGRREDERRNRIGIYIIVFEAYDSTSGKDKAFKKTVVIARILN